MSKHGFTLSLFSKKNRAVARKTDPQSSQDAADKLNEVDGVSKQEQEVMEALTKHGRCTAKELGIKMASGVVNAHGDVFVSPRQIDAIRTELWKPARRFKALVEDGKVIRHEDGTYEATK